MHQPDQREAAAALQHARLQMGAGTPCPDRRAMRPCPSVPAHHSPRLHRIRPARLTPATPLKTLSPLSTHSPCHVPVNSTYASPGHLQEEYKREGVDWSYVSFRDNADVLELLEGRMGLMDLLDETCRFPKVRAGSRPPTAP